MKTAFRKSFERDLKKIKDRSVLDRIRHSIEQVEQAHDPGTIAELKKLSGFQSAYRIRVGEYRIGLVIEGDRVEFICCLNRRDLYRFFP